MALIPRTYQEEAINKAIQLNLLLADKCGLGKTLVAIEVYLRTLEGSALIITRKNAKLQWKSEILKQDINANVVIAEKALDFDLSLFKGSPTHLYCITHYQALERITGLLKITWGLIVADEAHLIKNRQTKISKQIKKLKAIRKLALTATPTNKKFKLLSGQLVYNPAELWNIFRWLHPKNFRSYHRFYALFMITTLVETQDRTFKKEIGIKNEEQFLHLLEQIFLQRTKEEVLPELPPLISTRLLLPLTGTQEKIYKEFKQACKEDIIVTVEGITPLIVKNTLSIATNLQKLTSSPKLLDSKLLGVKLQWLHEFLHDTDDSVLIVSRFRDIALYIASKYDSEIVIGGFNTLVPDTEYKLITGTIRALAGALNLHFIDTVIFIDCVHSTIDMEQVRDRVHRMNITSAKNIIYLIIKDSVDELIIKSLENQWTEKVLTENLLRYIYEE